MKTYPAVLDPAKVGTYPALTKAGAGYVWDEVLEYRVWCHPERGAPDLHNGSDYHRAFDTYEKAYAYSAAHTGCESPLALVLQREYINEPTPGEFVHVKEERVTEWFPEFLSRPRRDARTLVDFFAPDAPTNRMDILQGRAPRTGG